MVTVMGDIFINKVWVANYRPFASSGTFMFNEASLELFVQDILQLYRHQDE
jgi:hypothetical protein